VRQPRRLQGSRAGREPHSAQGCRLLVQLQRRRAPRGPRSPSLHCRRRALHPSSSVRTFHRLTPAEQQERRRQGLCYNCDEPYMRGHQCQRLFYLECADFVEDDAAEAAATVEAAAGELAALPAAQTADAQPTVSLYAIAGIRTANAMRLPVTINGCRLVALLDSGSTHNFIDTELLPPPPRHVCSPDHTGLGGEWRPGSVSWSCPQCRTDGWHRRLRPPVLRHRLGRLRGDLGRRVPAYTGSYPMGLRRPVHDVRPRWPAPSLERSGLWTPLGTTSPSRSPERW